MTAIQLTLIPHHTKDGRLYQHLHFDLMTPDRIIQPEDLRAIAFPAHVQWQQGVAIEGRGPIWLYGYLVHECHPAAWVGCYDTRLGIVVVSTHSRTVAVGDILEIDLPAAAIPPIKTPPNPPQS
jgi:CRISPR-associated protein Csx3